VEEFEKDFAAFCNTRYAVGVNNGTTALHIAMLALGIGNGDEVIIPANTFIATAWVFPIPVRLLCLWIAIRIPGKSMPPNWKQK
jgi:hypothetical protein